MITLYAIYHLVRPAKARTPASSASYHMFALFMDIGLLPFYIFISLFSNNNYVEQPGTKNRWTSFFPEGATTTLLFITFLGAAVVAGLHLLSAILDLWLVILFRQISKLPPDMNPLEDNLTGRGPRTSKHKHKNSELTFTDSVAEKKPGYVSGSTLSVDDRSRLSTANKDTEDSRMIAFRDSRAGSEATFSPHNPETARWSRQNFEEVNVCRQSESARNSHVDVPTQSHRGSMTPSKQASWVEYSQTPPTPPRSSDRMNSLRPTSYPRARSGTNQASPTRFSSPALPNAAPSNALVKSQQKEGLLNSNWYSLDDGVSEVDMANRQRTAVPAINLERHGSFEPQPLKMNPPTPPPPKQLEYPDPGDETPYHLKQKRNALTNRSDNGNGDLNRHLTVQSTATNSSSVYSESAPSLKSSRTSGMPKGKYYGDLAAATRGVRGFKSNDTLKSNGTVEASTMDSTGMMALGEYGFCPASPIAKRVQPSPPKNRNGNGRVVSRSGADIAETQTMYPAQDGGYSMRGRRDVSGKVAEEGRGGNGWLSDRKRY